MSELTSFLPAIVVLAVAVAACVMMRLRDLAARRAHSFTLVQSVTVTSPAYRQALAVMPSRSAQWNVPGALGRLMASSDPDERRSAQGLEFLIGFFNVVAAGIRERAIDESVVRPMLARDLRALHATTRSCIAHEDGFEPLRWLIARWDVRPA